MKNILCSGNVSVDIKAYSAEVDDTEAYREGSIELVPGGVGRGMAINLKHLGFNTFIHSVVGKDIFGEYLRKGLEEEGIKTDLLNESPERKTALFSVMASRGKSATCVYSTQVLKEIVFNEQVEKVIKENNISTFVMDSNLSEETLEGFYNYKKSHPDIFVFQNATAPDIARKTMKYAPLINLFGCNEYEAATILGEKSVLPDLTTADKFQALGYKNFIITFGEQGVMACIGSETWNEPPYTPSQIVDTIGAGDAFASGFLMGFLENAPVKRCIHYGLACAKETLLTRQTVSNKLSKSFWKVTKMFDYLFFDLDGTLTDPALGITNSFIHALKYFGIEIPSYETLCTFIGPPLPETFKTQFGFDEEKAAEGVKKYREYFATKGLLENSVYPGIPELLTSLKEAGKKLVVATSKPEEYSVKIIEHFGLAKYFENVCGSLMNETRSKKDEVIEYAIERNHITDKSKILMIGDRKHDILGAKSRHQILWSSLGYGSLEELQTAGADFIAENVSRLDKICLQ